MSRSSDDERMWQDIPEEEDPSSSFMSTSDVESDYEDRESIISDDDSVNPYNLFQNLDNDLYPPDEIQPQCWEGPSR